MKTQPQEIEVQIPYRESDGAIMYSMMDEFTLRRLHKFIGELIEWKASGNPCYIGTYTAVITERKQNDET